MNITSEQIIDLKQLIDSALLRLEERKTKLEELREFVITADEKTEKIIRSLLGPNYDMIWSM